MWVFGLLENEKREHMKISNLVSTKLIKIVAVTWFDGPWTLVEA